MGKKSNKPVEVFDKKNQCCGCSACFSACPKSAISMRPDEEGFLYPFIDKAKCIDCKKCILSCSFQIHQKERSNQKMPSFKYGKFEKPITYAVKHHNEEIRKKSRSGGMFTALSDIVLEKHGVVYGCIVDELMQVNHVRAVDSYQRDRMRGSKYVQSTLHSIFIEVKQDLEEGRLVLFSGTSCQISGLNGYLGKKYDNLLTVDVVCHGVPSPSVWEKYIKWQEKQNKLKISSVDFRNKKDFGWKAHVETLYFENGKRLNTRVFTTLFYGHSILRPSCYNCPYKDTIHPGNITLADYWGIDNINILRGFNDDKGVSLVLINDEIGLKYFEGLHDITAVKTKIEDSMQAPFTSSFPMPNNREQVWQSFRNDSFSKFAKQYAGYGIVNKIRNYIKRIKRRKKQN